MCGIAGYFSWTGKPLEEGGIERMTASLNHRGPDDLGILKEGGVALGHARLSIIDLSDDGHQPMCNETGDIWLIFNGEIYNYEPLRRALIEKGHVFSSQTDSEVILHQYEEDGDACLEKFNGMFAFVLWDKRRNRILLARDRAGEKPLFYYFGDDFIVFGSEVKALLASKRVAPKIDIGSLGTCLVYNAMAAPETVVKNVRQLMPGEAMVCERGSRKTWRFWDLRDSLKTGQQPHRTDDDWFSEFSDRFDEAVRLRMRSDAPYGAFLSGGLDSSAVVKAMARANTNQPRTYAFGFKEGDFDEVPYASDVAARFGAAHQNIYAENVDLPALIDKCVWHGEEYTPNPCFIPVYLLCEGAGKDVKMILSGDGADELFGGYETHQASLMAKYYRRLPLPLRRSAQSLVNRLPASDAKVPLETKLKRFAYGTEYNSPDYHAIWRYIFRPDEVSSVLSKGVREEVANRNLTHTYREALAAADGAGELEQLLYADFVYYMPNDALVKLDRMGMANSVEIRSPFLDHTLVEFAFSMPSHLKLKRLMTKKVTVRNYLRDDLPAKLINRKKAGFNVPVDSWLRHELCDFMTDTLSPSTLGGQGIFDPDAVQSLVSEHLRGDDNHGLKIWNVLCVTRWYDMFGAAL